jgi:hypothetical protein
MSVGVMKDYKLKLRDLRASHTIGIHTRGSWKKKKIENIGPEDIHTNGEGRSTSRGSLSLSLSLSLSTLFPLHFYIRLIISCS